MDTNELKSEENNSNLTFSASLQVSGNILPDDVLNSQTRSPNFYEEKYLIMFTNGL